MPGCAFPKRNSGFVIALKGNTHKQASQSGIRTSSIYSCDKKQPKTQVDERVDNVLILYKIAPDPRHLARTGVVGDEKKWANRGWNALRDF